MLEIDGEARYEVYTLFLLLAFELCDAFKLDCFSFFFFVISDW